MQKRLHFFKLFFFLMLMPGYIFASTVTDLSTLLNGVHSMQANFVQTVYDNHQQAIQKSLGKIFLQRPGKFRWQVTKPIPQLIIANGSKLWIYDADLEQVTIRSLKQSAGETPALFLSHENLDLAQNYAVSELPHQGTLRWFRLVPKKADSMFASVEMGFLNQQIQQMNLQDHLGHVTKVAFKNIKTNIVLSSSLFNFKAPRQVDVIDETRQK